jgi:hypothetical protein
MAQSSGEREKPILQLENLIGKWSKSNGKDAHNADPKLDDIQKSWAEDVLRIQAVGAEEVDEVGQRKVEIDMLEAEQSSEQEATGKELFASQN